jgi:hypothetical protein
MSINYGSIIKNAFKFSFDPKRWLWFFILDVVFFSLALAVVFSNITALSSMLIALNTGAGLTGLGTWLNWFILAGACFIIWSLIRLWITGAIIHQSYKEKEFKKSWNISCKKYLSLLGAVIIITLISYIIGNIPLFSLVLPIIVSTVLFFALQGVIISNLGFYQALKNSWNIFESNIRKFKPSVKNSLFAVWLIILIISAIIAGYISFVSPIFILFAVVLWISVAIVSWFLLYSRVFFMLLITYFFSIVIVGIFSIPGIIVLFNVFLNTILTGAMNTQSLISAMFLIREWTGFLIIAAIIFLVGVAISSVFTLKIQTEFYLRLKKKFITS